MMLVMSITVNAGKQMSLKASLVHSRIDYANSLVHGPTNINKLYNVYKTQLLE